MQNQFEYDNTLKKQLYLQVTGRCNFNCLHCFAAKDNSPLTSEMSLEKINELLDMAKKCRVTSAIITGGEPTMHPHFSEIIKAFAEHGIQISTLVTNGYLLTQELIDLFKECGMKPTIRISFDGLGVHDYMRGLKGAEEATLKAIELCIKNSLEICVNLQVNKKTIDSIPETLRTLDSMGVSVVKLIKTTATPRWELNSNGDNYTFNEYFGHCLELIDDYSKEEHQMEVAVWLLNSYSPQSRKTRYTFPGGLTKRDPEKDDKKPICPESVNMICIGANGNVYPCMQMQGILDSRGISLGNVFVDGLQNILKEDSELSKCKNHTRAEKMAHNSKCKTCEFSKLCTTGCPTLSLIFHESVLDLDESACEYYESGLYEKVLSLAGYGVVDV